MTIRTIIALLLTGILSTGFMQAQPNAKAQFSGSITGQGGLGSATPYDGQIKLRYKADKWSIQPFAGITGITRQNSEEKEDICFRYSKSGNLYHSIQTTEREGYKLNYGTSLKFLFNADNVFAANIKAQSNQIKTFGKRRETFTTEDISSLFESPKQKLNQMDVNTSYVHTINTSNSLTFKYDFSQKKTEDKLVQSFTRNAGVSILRWTNIETMQNAEIIRHTASGEWSTILPQAKIVLKTGIKYDDREIKSKDQQILDTEINHTQDKNIEQEFNHRMQTTAAYVDFHMPLFFLPWENVWVLNTNLEYDYTKMQDRHLNDIAANVQAIMPLNSNNILVAVYVRKIIRPDLDKLNPMVIEGYYTIDHGTPDLEGIHANTAILTYTNTGEYGNFKTAVTHINVKDGFNAIWMLDQDERRVSFWGNQGIRKAWSVAPELNLAQLLPHLGLTAKATLLWDKRIAEAIHMAKEHWGITAELAANATLPQGFSLNLHGLYSEGNTIDLYSHEGRSYKVGALLNKMIHDNVAIILSYDYQDYARTILTQGAYTGRVFGRPASHHELLAKVKISF